MKWIERVLIVAAAFCFAWVYSTWREAQDYQAAARHQLERLTSDYELPGDPTVEAEAAAEEGAGEEGGDANALEPAGNVVGLLEIPRLALSVAVLEGDDARTLRRGAGHVPETPYPWDEGNTAVAGHRDTFFRALRRIELNDAVTLATPHGRFTYHVREILVVSPEDVWVLGNTPSDTLTLITCYPFTFVGSAPSRFIVRAERE